MELNMALSESGDPVEIHAMGEGKPFAVRLYEDAVSLGRRSADVIFTEQCRVLGRTRINHS